MKTHEAMWINNNITSNKYKKDHTFGIFECKMYDRLYLHCTLYRKGYCQTRRVINYIDSVGAIPLETGFWIIYYNKKVLDD